METNLLEPLPREEAQNQLQKWRLLLEEQLLLKDAVKVIDASSVETLDRQDDNFEVNWVYDMGKAAIVLALYQVKDGLFRPNMLVAEKFHRATTGSGDRQVREYQPLKVSGLPNFDRAIRSALDLSIKLTDRPKKRDLPRGVLVAPDKDHYLLHIGMLRVSPKQLDGIISVLLSDEGAQPAFDSSSGEDSAPKGGGGGICLASIEEAGEGGGQEGGLVSDPAPDIADAECEGLDGDQDTGELSGKPEGVLSGC